uniref:Uncharacterized protein n=1 Tax=Rhizophora mucronata TaxID=61149 RepID=A0A2P2N4W2_RHIMU
MPLDFIKSMATHSCHNVHQLPSSSCNA